ncbi:hypothetical protein [Niveibacterium sp.]|uniref:hypothetical protein n=1 Tax=Niveibacterium sp. TaxID=2017444 RepID=UPI0035B24B77
MKEVKGSRGFALPILLILLSALAAFVAVKTLRSFGGFELRASIRTDKALLLARDALIAHAAWEDSSPGSLLCPDFDNSGAADLNCSSLAVGRLPWRTLGIEMPLDGSGECLWYAISPNARSNVAPALRGSGGTMPAMNPSYLGDLTVRDSATGMSQPVVAVVIAPGRPLAGQSRTANATGCNGGPASAFLESRSGIDNAIGGPLFITGTASTTFNDRVMAITSEKLFTAAKARVLIALAGRDNPATNGLRGLYASGATAASLLADDGSGRLKLNFLDAAVLAAFSPPAGVLPKADGDCSRYDTVGNYTAEWLCFNRWLEFTQYIPTGSDSARLSLPGWQADFSVANPPRLVRTTHP